MPKVPSATFSSTNGEHREHGPNSAAVLKRNQACHQCRRRKLKCDAKRPCSTCIRSHRNTLNHAPPGSEVPPLECTFDDIPENGSVPHAIPKNRYEKLENRISELESLLRQKDSNTSADSQFQPPTSFHDPRPSMSGPSSSSHSSISQADQYFPGASTATLSLMTNDFGPQLDFNSVSPLIPAHISPITSPPHENVAALDQQKQQQQQQPGLNYATQVLWPNWPHNLPTLDLLQHLVEVFFAFHPHAGKLFHGPTFLSSLSFPPSHIKFPHVGVLHAICAVGSFYTALVEQPPLPNFAETPADDLFQTAYKRRKKLPDSFGEKHANYAKIAVAESTSLGERLFECQQALTILTWFYHCHAKWADMFTTTGRAVRYLVPLGLNMCPPFHSISKSLRAPSIILPAKTVIEDETRRNTFWLTYATERLYSSGNGWAMCLDDQDISQLLPVRADQFDRGVLVPPKNRQWAHSPNMLLDHPPEQTDAFVLYIKSSVVMSRVKTFNLRFRAKNYAGDPMMAPPPGSVGSEQSSTAQYIDPRETLGFKEIDTLVDSFVPSFPRHLRHPVKDNVLDMHLLLAHLSPNIAKILLHDPHADLTRTGCISRVKILEAARSNLDLLYSILSTSYDLTLLDNFCCFAFFMTGRVIVRFLQNAKDSNDQSSYLTFRTELEFIRLALAKIGARLPLAYRYAKMLDDIVYQSVGILEELPLPTFDNIAQPVTSELVLPTMTSDNSLELLFGTGSLPSLPLS